MKPGLKKIVIFGTILLFPGILFIYLSKGEHKFAPLPYFGPKEIVENDSIPYKVPTITLKGIQNESIVLDTLKNTIKIIELFSMQSRIRSIAEKFDDEKDILFLSVLSFPTERNKSKLVDYINRSKNRSPYWKFYQVENTSVGRNYFSFLTPDYPEANFDNIDNKKHNFYVLIDKDNHIRGYYDTKTTSSLQEDIRLLKKIEDKENYKRKKENEK